MLKSRKKSRFFAEIRKKIHILYLKLDYIESLKFRI